MKNKFALAVACLVLLSGVPALAEDGAAPGEHGKVWATLGLRPEGPEERLRVGQRVNAAVENPTTLSQRGVTAKRNDKVVLTLTGKNSVTLLHTASGRTFRFKIDGRGNVTPAP